NALQDLDLSPGRTSVNLAPAELVERALIAGEGRLASNGALACLTGDRTGRSPKDKFLEDAPSIHDKIWWGNVNQPMPEAAFEKALRLAVDYLNQRPRVYTFDGFAGADPTYRLGVRVVTEQAWHSLFAQTLFIRPGTPAAGGPSSTPFKADWTILNAGKRRLTPAEAQDLGVKGPVLIAQSLTRKIVVILGTEYAGEIKKSIFY